MENKTTENVNKRGRSRILSSEEEFFLILVRLRCGFPLEDLAIRYNMSTSHISRILITWTDFLHSQFRMLPIWASRQHVEDTMPKCFKKEYPSIRRNIGLHRNIYRNANVLPQSISYFLEL